MKLTRLSESIVVGHLETPIDGASVVPLSMPVSEALQMLEQSNFDQAPVVEHGEPIGYVLTEDLRTSGTVESKMRPILPAALASNTSPLEVALPWLENSGFLFLLAGKSISGFVVPSDLNKQAGRSYFYLGLTELELRLAAEARRLGIGDEALGCLNAQARRQIRQRVRANTEQNIDADVVAEMNLSDLFKIVGCYSELPSTLEVEDWDEYWAQIKQLRTRVAHSAKPVLESPAEIGRLLDADRAVHAIIDALSRVHATTHSDSSA